MVANLHFQLIWYNQITLLPPPKQHHSFFRNFHPLSNYLYISKAGGKWKSFLSKVNTTDILSAINLDHCNKIQYFITTTLGLYLS